MYDVRVQSALVLGAVCLVCLIVMPVSGAMIVTDTSVSPSADPITVLGNGEEISVPGDTVLAAIQYALNGEGLPLTVGVTQWKSRGVLLLNDVGEYAFSDIEPKAGWTVYVNGKVMDGFSHTPSALNIAKVASGDVITGEYSNASGVAATFSITVDPQAVNVLTVPTPIPTQEVAMRDASEVVSVFEGVVTPSKDPVLVTSMEGNTYEVPGNTVLGMIYTAAVQLNYSCMVTDKKWVDGSNEVLLFNDFGPYTYLRGSSAWNMYVNGELADGFVSKARSVNAVTVEDGDVITGEYVDPYGLNATMKIELPGSANPVKPYILRLKKISAESPDYLYGNLPSGKRVAVTGEMLADARAQMKRDALFGT